MLPDDKSKPAAGAPPADGSGNPPALDATPDNQETWDGWISKQPKTVQDMYKEHTNNLRNAVAATRQERDDLKKQLTDALPKVAKGSELEKSLTDTLSKLEAAEKKALFLEDAMRPEIGCRNPKAAFAIAVSESLFDRKGNPDWSAIKQTAPELFGTLAAPPANAGSGTGEPPPTTLDMNMRIRRAAGRQT